ncbi:MAG: DUF368 domain-containing protein [Cytophagales bacterium]|nr:DUF368 domain-containing protein [Cytophagales bacterium]
MKEKILVYLKGICVGAVDLIPGVSGGTIALIMGIYPRLIQALRSFDKQAFQLLLKGRWRELWEHLKGPFLFSFLLGIGTSVLSFAHLLKYLLGEIPILLWSFFGSLIFGASLRLFYSFWGAPPITLIWLGLGICSTYFLPHLPAVTSNPSYPILYLYGIIAICAGLLPGISGSSVMLALGAYEFLVEAITRSNVPVLFVVALGCITGGLLFSRGVHFLLNRYPISTLSFLVGCMLGSLNGIWGRIADEINQAGDTHYLWKIILAFLFGIAIISLFGRWEKRVKI